MKKIIKKITKKIKTRRMNQMANFHEFSKSINTNNVHALPSKNESQKLVALNVKKELSCLPTYIEQAQTQEI
jgi:hypothetical protein